ncbi:MAG: hypothetical protein E7236_05370 [Lachnospiraceae bacterium]|nr:hypothetical protein [Lachnospiraceae bacterium]
MGNDNMLLLQQKYDIGECDIVFSLYREIKDDEVIVTLTYQFQVPGAEEVPCKRFHYPLCAERYQSPYLSWYNLICCSNNYGPIPVVSYMNYSVQEGKKIAATIYPDTAEEYMKIIADTTEGYYCFPFNIEEYQYMLYISRKGTLADYFDLDEILSVYRESGIELDKEKMQEYFAKELNWFGNAKECPIEIHNCLGNEELATVGLLFGYPVESTVALLHRTIDMFEE